MTLNIKIQESDIALILWDWNYTLIDCSVESDILKPCAYAAGLLQYFAKNNFKQGIFSNGNTSSLIRKTQILKWNYFSWINGVVDEECFQYYDQNPKRQVDLKPSTDGIEHAARIFQIKTTAILMIGDSDADRQSAVNANFIDVRDGLQEVWKNT